MTTAERAFCLSARGALAFADSQTKDLVLGNLKLRAPPTSIGERESESRHFSYGLMRYCETLMQVSRQIYLRTLHLSFFGYNTSYEVHTCRGTVGLGIAISVLVKPHRLILFLIVYSLSSLPIYCHSPGHPYLCANTLFRSEKSILQLL